MRGQRNPRGPRVLPRDKEDPTDDHQMGSYVVPVGSRSSMARLGAVRTVVSALSATRIFYESVSGLDAKGGVKGGSRLSSRESPSDEGNVNWGNA